MATNASQSRAWSVTERSSQEPSSQRSQSVDYQCRRHISPYWRVAKRVWRSLIGDLSWSSGLCECYVWELEDRRCDSQERVVFHWVLFLMGVGAALYIKRYLFTVLKSLTNYTSEGFNLVRPFRSSMRKRTNPSSSVMNPVVSSTETNLSNTSWIGNFI